MSQKKSSGDDDGPGTGAPFAGGPAQPYLVLARKYRPETFDDLIGQQSMVRTLENAFKTDRIAQGYILTGVRGVGKTTTARILARALNYAKDGLPDRPTTTFDGYGAHCLDIIQSRHPDVVEMDAASNTGIESIREIIESARYKPLVARYKVFIIDEVHMLSKSAFNGLLKTLEEPPAHVKFVFATTEIRKVPVTVLSRCQRFDLRRVDVADLAAHFDRICKLEGSVAEPEGLTLIARAAQGSVRDGLSILDQAIATGAGSVRSTDIRAMLGLADRSRVFDLLEQILSGHAGAALATLSALHRDGAEPIQTLTDLAEAVHVTTRAKIAGESGAGEDLSVEEKQRAGRLAERLSIPLLSRAWQILLKGLDEASRAPDPVAAVDMLVVRLAYLADLPTPDEAIRLLGGERPQPHRPVAGSERASRDDGASRGPLNRVEGDSEAARSANDGSVAARAVDDGSDSVDEDGDPQADEIASRPSGLASPRSFVDVVALAGEKRDARLKLQLEDCVSLVRFEPFLIELCPLPGAPSGLAGELMEKLGRWTGHRWMVALTRDPGERPLGEVRREREAAELAELRAHPAVKAVLESFPGADIGQVKALDLLERDDTATG